MRMMDINTTIQIMSHITKIPIIILAGMTLEMVSHNMMQKTSKMLMVIIGLSIFITLDTFLIYSSLQSHGLYSVWELLDGIGTSISIGTGSGLQEIFG